MMLPFLFRSSVAERMGVYNTIKEFYSSVKNKTNGYKLPMDHTLRTMDFMNFTTELGHQKEDFIYEYV
jgi:hypothetical protein